MNRPTTLIKVKSGNEYLIYLDSVQAVSLPIKKEIVPNFLEKYVLLWKEEGWWEIKVKFNTNETFEFSSYEEANEAYNQLTRSFYK